MSEPRDFLPYGRHEIDEADIQAVVRVLRGDWLTTGPAVEAFESAFAATVGAEHAVSCNSGTAALHLAAMALGIGPGDHVFVPAITFVSTANVVRHAGGEVVFADVDPATGLMTPETLEEARARLEGSSRARAVFPVHLNGQCADMVGIGRLARAHGLRVVEDACHAIGGSYPGADGGYATVGGCRHGDVAAFSLHPVKTVTMGEGGVATTNDSDLADRLRSLRAHGMTRARFENADLAFAADGTPNPWYHEFQVLGFNYRASDIQCALGLSQLRKLDGFVARRRALAARYDALLEDLAPLARPVSAVHGGKPAWHLYAVLIDFAAAGVSRAVVMNELRARGIGTQVHYIPVHRQPYYRARYGHIHLPGAEAYYARCLSLPLFPAMTERDVERVVDALRAVLAAGEPAARASLRRELVHDYPVLQ